MNKKTTAKALLATMGLTVLMPAASALAATDINGHWCENVIERWENEGLIAGYEDGSFRPDQPITRAEFISLVNRYLGFNTSSAISFSDVDVNDWYAKQVAIAVTSGYVGGFDDNTFRPGDYITRAQTASIIARLTHLSNKPEESYKFDDAYRNPEWAKGVIGAVAAKGYMIGDEKNNFDAPDPLTRAEAVAILDRLRFLLEGGSGTSTPVAGGGGTVDVRSDVVVFDRINTNTAEVNGEYVITTEKNTKLGELLIVTTVFGTGDELISNLNGALDAKTEVIKIPTDVEITKVTLPKSATIYATNYDVSEKYQLVLKEDIVKTGEYTFTIEDIYKALKDENSNAGQALSDLARMKGWDYALIECEQVDNKTLNWKFDAMTAAQQEQAFSQLIVTLEKN